MKSRLHKKGVFQDWLPMVVGIVVLTLLFFFMFLGKTVKEVKINQEVAQKAEEFNADRLLMHYLSSTVETSGRNRTVADLIALSVLNRNYALLEAFTQKLYDNEEVYMQIRLFDADRYTTYKSVKLQGSSGLIKTFQKYHPSGQGFKGGISIAGAKVPAYPNTEIGRDKIRAIYVEMEVIR